MFLKKSYSLKGIHFLGLLHFTIRVINIWVRLLRRTRGDRKTGLTTKWWVLDFYFFSFIETKEYALIRKATLWVMNLNLPPLSSLLWCVGGERLLVEGEVGGWEERKFNWKRETGGERTGGLRGGRRTKHIKGENESGQEPRGDSVASPKTHQTSPVKIMKIRPCRKHI